MCNLFHRKNKHRAIVGDDCVEIVQRRRSIFRRHRSETSETVKHRSSIFRRRHSETSEIVERRSSIFRRSSSKTSEIVSLKPRDTIVTCISESFESSSDSRRRRRILR
ncbi:uncharacterized protein PHALS_08204 [Plasmopara halstedii]|uniref:Uncharacterized protein n=1 Tax=Plasmopara halstedii TaxID=4781 RepID=A0A0P1ACM0_PLAHL|nr:uncharacterized protein PHALS_08204 [Plasmopara halstedii]CEG38110.1 hypothetical protein PHALS_08204 [Plasmopara halstedii]|eukprot:XP_024574479.1 hypothetical protein PHALS_08204 [Plasmopara halstedii]